MLLPILFFSFAALLALFPAMVASGPVECEPVQPAYYFCTGCPLALSRNTTNDPPALADRPVDGYFRTLAITAGRLQTVQASSQGTPWSFYTCTTSYTSTSNITDRYTVGKFVVEPLKTAEHLSAQDECLTFHPHHRQFGLARCSFVDDASQGLQTFATDTGYLWRYIGPPLDLWRYHAAEQIPESGWRVLPRLNRKNNEWTVEARFEGGTTTFDGRNGFVEGG